MKKIVYFLIKAPKLVQHLLNLYYLHIRYDAIKITNHIMLKSRECIVEAVKVLNSKYSETSYLNRWARDGHIQKLIKGSIHPGH